MSDNGWTARILLYDSRCFSLLNIIGTDFFIPFPCLELSVAIMACAQNKTAHRFWSFSPRSRKSNRSAASRESVRRLVMKGMLSPLWRDSASPMACSLAAATSDRTGTRSNRGRTTGDKKEGVDQRRRKEEIDGGRWRKQEMAASDWQ